MRRSFLWVTGAAVVLAAGAVVPAAAEDGARDAGFTIEDPRITESSGLAASRAHPGVYWTHNDSDDGPYVYAVDSRTGRTVATITLRGVGDPRDVEAISVGADGNVYVGDIGDNLNGSWDHVWIYRFPEPKTLRDATVDADQFTVQYADGARNAEAMMVHPRTGRIYIASKDENKGGLYAGPERLSTSGANVFRRVGDVPWVTDGAFSPDGRQLVLRSYFSARAYDWKDGGALDGGRPVNAPFQGQSESVTYTTDGSALMFGSEGERSQVERVEIGDSGAKPPSGEGGSDSGPDAGSSSGADAGADGEGGGDGDGGGVSAMGAVVIAGVVVALFGFGRRRRKG